jgi:predicted nuclease of predicted toxin-antitoxin system
MRLYLDDDSASPLLVRLMRQAGHDAQLPRDAGLDGVDDPVHLTHAVREGRVCLTGNHDDFRILHNLIEQAQGHHPGILVVRRDNDPRRDMTPRGIVLAIGRLIAANVPITDQIVILNH